ncbi:hypothetical protein P879_10813 [Paragonimus westermani]|uniref:tRNA-uridine aminocarboxypropyltransferase n=1 Tax=Paragonimus westermani TaxID=34504 RepID=A0A8T0DJL6_9TREM|nr:hypothetical protein P879_10813 [Paragonimus westermani]
MLTGSPLLFAMKRVCLPPNPETGDFTQSEFIVRRQPFPAAVCTVEAVARILDLWEPTTIPRGKDFYQTQLLRPLRRICEIQTAWKSEHARKKQLPCQPIEHFNRSEMEIYPTHE